LFACGEGKGETSYAARYDVVVESVATRQLSKGMIWLFLPVTGRADVAPVDTLQTHVVGDSLGNRQISISLDDIPVGFELPLSISVTWPMHPLETDLPVNPAESQFLSAEPLVEIDQPPLRDRAASIRSNDLSKTLANIRAEVSAIQPRDYPPTADVLPVAGPAESIAETPHGALSAIETGVGDGADRVLLAVALLRAVGLPARPVAGIVDDGDGVLAASERQLWAEYFSDGAWHAFHLADIDVQSRAVVFRIFARAGDLAHGSVAENFYRGAGLRIRNVH
jgi:hypothetical protein